MISARRLKRVAVAGAALFLSSIVVHAATASAHAAEIVVKYLRQEVTPPPTLSNLDPMPENLGVAGVMLGVADNETTGGFLGQIWSLEIVSVPPDGDFMGAARSALAASDLVILDAPADLVRATADLDGASEALFFNAAAQDGALRDAECRANLLHTVPSRAMLADALMQFFVSRRWNDLAMIAGAHPADVALAEAFEASAQKFGLEISARKTWAFDADMRRNASQEVPLFTQELGEYDVLVVADDANDFARYIPYNTWRPRPVAGSEGLTPQIWDRVVEAWGAAQLQSRFEDQHGRSMRGEDYAAWAAIRAIGEAVTRTGASDAATLRAYMLGPDFELAGFKGRPLTFRDWNGQLRQPIPLTHRGALVANAPLEGFLHQTTELDTLGLDRAESRCAAFATGD